MSGPATYEPDYPVGGERGSSDVDPDATQDQGEDDGLPDDFEEFLEVSETEECEDCENLVRPRFVEDGVCMGCRYGTPQEDDQHELATDGGTALVQSPGQTNRRLGPHTVPRIECGKCGTSHHYDAAAGEYQGRCRNCSGFLRRPTEEEHDQFTDFLVWNSRHLDRDADHGGEVVAE